MEDFKKIQTLSEPLMTHTVSLKLTRTCRKPCRSTLDCRTGRHPQARVRRAGTACPAAGNPSPATVVSKVLKVGGLSPQPVPDLYFK
jgi:hypothetical protein